MDLQTGIIPWELWTKQTSVGLFESFGTLLGILQNRKSMQTFIFVLLKFWF